MVEPLWYRCLNYETAWMTRRKLQDVSYRAIGSLVRIKAELGLLPDSMAQTVLSTIEETTALLSEMERNLKLDGHLSARIRNAVREYNGKILAYSSDQILPLSRPFGGRWFDDFTVPPSLVADCIRD